MHTYPTALRAAAGNFSAALRAAPNRFYLFPRGACAAPRFYTAPPSHRGGKNYQGLFNSVRSQILLISP